MPRRTKKVSDWSLTFSPKEDVTGIPEWFCKLHLSGQITRMVAIAERHSDVEKWHIHIAFTYRREYNNDYVWWEQFSGKPTEDNKHELQIKYHDDIFCLAGGYLTKAKTGDRQVILSEGFTPEQLEFGQKQYERYNRRKRMRDWQDRFLVVHPAKLELTLAAYLDGDANTIDEAIVRFTEDGFVSQGLGKETRNVLQSMHRERRLLNE